MMENKNCDGAAWERFAQSGKISDYLQYNKERQDTLSKVGANAAKDEGNNFKATEYR